MPSDKIEDIIKEVQNKKPETKLEELERRLSTVERLLLKLLLSNKEDK